MNETEAKKIIALMMMSYSNYKPADVDYAAKVWADILEEYTYEQASIGLKAYIKADKNGFAPAPGQIIDKIHSLTEPQELNEMEAWALVSKAIRNSGYYSVEEYTKMPPLVQKAVGLPEQLRAWALDENYNEEVVSSNFIKCYKSILEREREIRKMPKQIRDMIEKINETSYSGQIEQRRKDIIENSNEMNSLEMKMEGVPMPDRVKEIMEMLKEEE